VTPPKASPTPRVGRAPRGPIEGRRDREHIRTVVVPDHDDLALRLADRIVEVIARETAAKDVACSASRRGARRSASTGS